MKTVFSKEQIALLLHEFNIDQFENLKLIDSSRGEDVRLNYIVDLRFVLRINSEEVMTESRISEINRLVARYNDFGLIAPCFLKNRSDGYVIKSNGIFCYLSQYADYPLASDEQLKNEDKLAEQIIANTAAFAEKYKNIDLSSVMSMYSLFDLCPYDIPCGIDEKQQNLNDLTDALISVGEEQTAEMLKNVNQSARSKLKKFYKQLPRCVFQGDENFTNVLIDDCQNYSGLIDFNMSGTDVIVNYFANIAGFDLEEEDLKKFSAPEIYSRMLKTHEQRLKIIEKYYRFDGQERRALTLYADIVKISSYPLVACYIYCLKDEKLRTKTVELLKLICKDC